MNNKLCLLVILAAAFLGLTGESCFLSSKTVEVPLRGDADADFVSVGTVDTNIDCVDFFQEILKLEDEGGDIDELVDITVENIYWRLVENRGDPNTTVQGTVLVSREGGLPAELIPMTTIDLSTVGPDYQPTPVTQAGLDLILQGFDEYIQWRNEGGVEPQLNYCFTWQTSSVPAADFSWQARMKFTVIGVFEVEVPDLWD